MVMSHIYFLFKKYKPLILYVFFGIATTIINVVCYNLCYNYLVISNVISTCIAWLAAVLFAFVTNKLFVFDSKSFAAKVIIYELTTFFSCRLLTGVMDIAIMFVCVDLLRLNPILWKIFANVLVIIFNYIASKLIIFKSK